MTKIAGSGSGSESESGSISQRHGSADPDPPKNVMDQEHCLQSERRQRELECWPMPSIKLMRVFCVHSVLRHPVHHITKCTSDKSHSVGSLSFSQIGGPPCWVISLAFRLITYNSHQERFYQQPEKQILYQVYIIRLFLFYFFFI
jgi:hypothetical protein